MNSYVLISVKVEGDVEEGLKKAQAIIKLLAKGGFDDLIVLNTIPAPE